MYQSANSTIKKSKELIETENLLRESTANSTIKKSKELIKKSKELIGLIEPDGNCTLPNSLLDGDACKDIAEELQKNFT